MKVKNDISKEEFEEKCKNHGYTLEPLEPNSKCQKAWKLSEKFFNDGWIIVFTGEVDEFSVYHYHSETEKYARRIDLVLTGDSIEIVRAWANRRTAKSEFLLKRYVPIAKLISCYKQYGFLK